MKLKNTKQKTYLILPGCDDTNRGDQALIWVSVDLARKAGFEGDYFMLSNSDQCLQSAGEGIGQVDYVLNHPSVKFRGSNNIRYTPFLKLKWAVAAAWDLVTREPLVHPVLRKLMLPLYSEKTKRALEKFAQADRCFVKGGGFLHAHGSLADTYKIYYFLYHIRLAQSFGTDVVVMPNSFGPFRSPLVKGMVSRTLRKCSAVMSRESISSRQLQSHCGICSMEFADLAFHLREDADFDAVKYLRDRGIPIGEKTCVAITARPYRFPGEPDGARKYRSYQQSLAEFARWLMDRNVHPVFVEHVFSDMDHENDMTCIREIQSMMESHGGYSVFSDRTLNCRQMKRIYGAFDCTVGTRFHSVIFSLASLVPSIAITYGGNKGDGIMMDLDLGDFALPISTVSAESLIEAYEKLENRRDNIEETLKKAMERMKLQQKDLVAAIKESV